MKLLHLIEHITKVAVSQGILYPLLPAHLIMYELFKKTLSNNVSHLLGEKI